MYVAIVFLPLIGCLIAGLGRKPLGDRAAMGITTGLVVTSFALSLAAFATNAAGAEPQVIRLAPFITVGDFQSNWSIRVDMLTAVMLVVVTSVSSLVHIYSVGYMSHDPDRARFFAYLSLFTFAMLMLVTANDFVQLFFGWEGVGLASYLLIGFWYKKDSANAASIKAFVTNRVGDVGLALGIFAVFITFGSVEFEPVLAAIAANAEVAVQGAGAIPVSDATLRFIGMDFPALEIMALLLFIGAMGKSAQFFLHVWLPDAMEGPTPVSALIHAATMVTAGVFLLCRLSPLYAEASLTSAFITVIGATTALYAATVGLAQNDIKRVVAYSTCSQLGYMFFAAGIGSYGAAMFHLFTHAFFKALLFLGAGAVIHGLHDEQDMRKMGGVASKMRWTWALMIIGTLALTGVGIPGTQFGFAGFFSKDRIIEDAYLIGVQGSGVAVYAFWAGIVAALLTSFYSFRLLFMTFHGTFKGPKEHLDHAHDAPWVMRGPLVLLGIGAVVAGTLFYGSFVGKAGDEFWGQSIVYEYGSQYGKADASHGVEAGVAEAGAEVAHAGDAKGHSLPLWVLWAPVVVTLIGFLLAVWFYLVNEGMGARIAANGGPLHRFLLNKWYFDEIYNAVFVKGARALGDVFWKGDKRVIDGLGPDGVAKTTLDAGKAAAKGQTGYLYHYAFIMLVGVVVLASVALLGARAVSGS